MRIPIQLTVKAHIVTATILVTCAIIGRPEAAAASPSCCGFITDCPSVDMQCCDYYELGALPCDDSNERYNYCRAGSCEIH